MTALAAPASARAGARGGVSPWGCARRHPLEHGAAAAARLTAFGPHGSAYEGRAAMARCAVVCKRRQKLAQCRNACAKASRAGDCAIEYRPKMPRALAGWWSAAMRAALEGETTAEVRFDASAASFTDHVYRIAPWHRPAAHGPGHDSIVRIGVPLKCPVTMPRRPDLAERPVDRRGLSWTVRKY